MYWEAPPCGSTPYLFVYITNATSCSSVTIIEKRCFCNLSVQLLFRERKNSIYGLVKTHNCIVFKIFPGTKLHSLLFKISVSGLKYSWNFANFSLDILRGKKITVFISKKLDFVSKPQLMRTFSLLLMNYLLRFRFHFS